MVAAGLDTLIYWPALLFICFPLASKVYTGLENQKIVQYHCHEISLVLLLATIGGSCFKMPGAKWNKYFPNDIEAIKERYIKAKAIYENILKACVEK